MWDSATGQPRGRPADRPHGLCGGPPRWRWGGSQTATSSSPAATTTRCVCGTRPPPASHAADPLTGHTGNVKGVAIGRIGDRDVIVSGSTDGTVRVWDQHGAPVGGPLTYRLNQVLAVAVGRLGDRDVIISGELFGAVRVWDEHGAPVGEPLGRPTPAT